MVHLFVYLLSTTADANPILFVPPPPPPVVVLPPPPPPPCVLNPALCQTPPPPCLLDADGDCLY